jgi:hypothetical protein
MPGLSQGRTRKTGDGIVSILQSLLGTQSYIHGERAQPYENLAKGRRQVEGKTVSNIEVMVGGEDWNLEVIQLVRLALPVLSGHGRVKGASKC